MVKIRRDWYCRIQNWYSKLFSGKTRQDSFGVLAKTRHAQRIPFEKLTIQHPRCLFLLFRYVMRTITLINEYKYSKQWPTFWVSQQMQKWEKWTMRKICSILMLLRMIFEYWRYLVYLFWRKIISLSKISFSVNAPC